jgi:hypothetical protein
MNIRTLATAGRRAGHATGIAGFVRRNGVRAMSVPWPVQPR